MNYQSFKNWVKQTIGLHSLSVKAKMIASFSISVLVAVLAVGLASSMLPFMPKVVDVPGIKDAAYLLFGLGVLGWGLKF